MSSLTLYNFLGTPKKHFDVLVEDIDTSSMKMEKALSHLIFVLDASGSMYYDMPALRTLVEKLLTLEEYRDSGLMASVLSFSSSGDLIEHIIRTSVNDIMKPGSSYVEQIRKLSTRGMTCISQGLERALDLAKPGEVTGIVLLSDGYANDRSPVIEKRAIEALIERASSAKEVFINTIGLRDWCDYNLLNQIANVGSGKCWKVPSVKEAHDAIHETADTLAGNLVPALSISADETVAYQIFVGQNSRKIIGSSGDLLIRGLQTGEIGKVYKFIPTLAPRGFADLDVAYAYSRAMLSEGKINEAKFALVGTRNEELLKSTYRALVNVEIAGMATKVEEALFDKPAFTRTGEIGLPDANKTSVLEILGVLSESRGLDVDMNSLRAVYRRRGVKRVLGKRDENNNLVGPEFVTKPREKKDWLPIGAFELNRAEATCNMRVSQEVDLIEVGTGAKVDEIAGIDVDLKSYNNYTLVSDGELNVPAITVRIGDKKAFRRLTSLGAIDDGLPFDPKEPYVIDFQRPLIPFNRDVNVAKLKEATPILASLKVLASLLGACAKGESDRFTAEQIAELKKHYVTPALYFSPPTTTEYADLQKALGDGSVDVRLKYKIEVGTPDYLTFGDFYSANEFLARHYGLTLNGEAVAKPKVPQVFESGAHLSKKAPSSRMKINKIDDLMKPIFDDFFGFEENQAISKLLAAAKIEENNENDIVGSIRRAGRNELAAEDRVEAILDAKRIVENAQEEIYRDLVSPMVFFIGATGLMPESITGSALTADQLKAAMPDVSIGKAQQEGMFYDLDGTILSVAIEPAYFSTRGLDADPS
jgi:Mg-chelatase subunit ChlD